ncbi:MAG: AlpA family phage regulatory protein [uncultured bacterium]|uniref:Phage regulatory protein, AlpA family n=1 Tax=Citrifermentans bemidjiense (strain ATCC BAA-1014 / DSM 16622 / JCM 12645 / Bem) TaxID=404380 RepID=B5E9S4_CITBB|nr:phage regulatory protein, AlpA family [Citrifermentans bemidjiense Bem]EKD59088.1 MAG: AlpA family phage regulatory protein [uncultured bacterium]
MSLPKTGYVRLSQILGNPKANPPIPAIIPVSKSTWWAGVKSGRYPAPVRHLGPRITAWRAEDIRAFIESPSNNHHGE